MITAMAVCWGLIVLLAAVAGWQHPRTRHAPRRPRDRVDV
jgi:hypothetical protein